MCKEQARRSLWRAGHFELLEPRAMLSASPGDLPFADADFVLDYFADVEPARQPITRFSFDGAHGHSVQSSLAPLSLAGAHLQTGLAAARAAYGLTGRGQTVAIIDTGVAFDHPALGGGWGSRVVGGWDYAENDANPYDDPTGAHGTHVAGIIGNSDPANPGVATGVDIVAMRVFADNGSGYFSWVENALRWVYQNRNGFRNPITTVNLSLGAVYNGSSAPAWGQLEDEFQQLENVGIFVAVAAGNNFTSYGTPGLSYPAASPYVVPVSAVDGAGNLASFSQRLDRVIAAPGVSIRSTVPDYMGNLNGRADDWASFSGTSMASPYVAGASILIREAMAFAGRTNITQDAIYQVMASTADWVYDPATAQNYRKLNMQRALDSVMPADDYGSTIATAHALGTIGVGGSFRGAISRTTDHDYFTFTAAASGTINFTASTSYELDLRWEIVNAGGAISTYDANDLSLEVAAGQTYTIGICTTAGVGFYSVGATTGLTATDLGKVDFRETGDRAVNSEQWYGFTATRTGALTVEALLNQAGGNIDLRLYNSKYELIGASARAGGNERIDIPVVEGQRLYVQLLGSNAHVSLRVANLVAQAGASLFVYGTGGNDAFSFNAGITHRFTVNGVAYTFGWQNIKSVSFDGLAGSDTITLGGTSIGDRGVLRPGSAAMSASWYQATAGNFENITLVSGGGGDTAVFYDSSGDDILSAGPAAATFQGAGATNVASGFSRVEVYASSGNDAAAFQDSPGNDTYIASPTYAALVGAGFYNLVFGFDQTRADSSGGGHDTATLFDSAGNDAFLARPTSARLYGAGWLNEANGFAAVTARASGGWDMAYFFDSAGNDAFVAGSNYAWLEGAAYRNCGVFFDLMVGYASGGDDTASLIDSIYNDQLELDGRWAKLNGQGFFDWANGFDRVNCSGANGGTNSIVHTSPHDFVFNQLGAWAA